MTKLKLTEATIGTVLELIGDLMIDDPDANGDQIAMKLHQYKANALGDERKIAVTDFTFSNVIKTFKLTYSDKFNLSHQSHWAIEAELQSTFPMIPCFCSHLLSYHVL